MLKDVAAALAADIRHFKTIFIVVDALDEFPTSEHTIGIILQDNKRPRRREMGVDTVCCRSLGRACIGR